MQSAFVPYSVVLTANRSPGRRAAAMARVLPPNDPSKTICYGDEDAQALSQLSDLVVLNSQDDHGHALAQPYTTETFSQQGVSQEALELQAILDQSPSQPDLPLGQLMQAAGASLPSQPRPWPAGWLVKALSSSACNSIITAHAVGIARACFQLFTLMFMVLQKSR